DRSHFLLIRRPPRPTHLPCTTLFRSNAENVKNALIKATDGLSDQERRKLYEYFYMIITGKSYGPRAAPLLALMGRERVMSILDKIR
ncbi:MAG: hypothetical protein QXM54_03215, partial [Desulfurococcaceae archaeon]